ncbi:MAG TPA: cytochrome c oxidase subunit 4 [Candidatus Dormibacteraeota bacterium]|nr:cytochrome c oxidase subunit 4 [Candidatus Dormibacteraeota bacterium]
MMSLSDEAKVFARMSIFGIVVGGAYWFLTYEVAGTVLLLGFGLAAGLATVANFIRSRRAAGDATSAGDEVAGGESVPGESAEAYPEPGWAPLVISLGVGGLALGAAFGPWLTIAGLLVVIAGGASWLSAAIREARSAHESRPPGPDGG